MEKRPRLKLLKISSVDVSFDVIYLYGYIICIMALSFCTKNELKTSVLYVFTCTVYLILFQIPIFILFSF